MTEEVEERPAPKGIRGWLILPAIGTTVAPLFLTWYAVESSSVLLTGSLGSTALKVFVIGEFLSQCALLGGWIYATVLLWHHRAGYPRMFIVFSLLTLGFTIVDYTVATGLFDYELQRADINSLGRQVVSSAIWITYMRLSRRVQNTFVD